MITNYFYLIHTADFNIIVTDYKIFFIRSSRYIIPSTRPQDNLITA